MVRLLADLSASAKIWRNPYLNDRRAELIPTLEPPRDPRRRLDFGLSVANEYLRAGRTKEAIRSFESLWQRVAANPQMRDSPGAREVQSLLAISYMRLGEQQNCIENHEADSCLLPIRDKGVHVDQTGSRAAIRLLSAILARHPEDLSARWLLNIAYMTVGEYPAKVPAPWLIPPSAFASDYDVGRFVDVAAKSGLDIDGLAGAGIIEDFDGDQHLDIMVTSWGLRDQMQFFRNNRDGTFGERTKDRLGAHRGPRGLRQRR
jgi:hypothetical protein